MLSSPSTSDSMTWSVRVVQGQRLVPARAKRGGDLSHAVGRQGAFASQDADRRGARPEPPETVLLLLGEPERVDEQRERPAAEQAAGQRAGDGVLDLVRDHIAVTFLARVVS